MSKLREDRRHGALSMRLCRRFALSTLFVSAVGCSPPEPGTVPIRLVDRFPEAVVAGTPTAVAGPEYGESVWTFADDGGEGAAPRFRAEEGVAELRIEGDALCGQTTSEAPLLVARRDSAVPADEVLYSVEVRMKASAGTDLTVRFGGDPLVLPAVLGSPFGQFKSPLRAGDEMQTYVIRPARTVTAEQVAHVVLSPTNAADAEFAVESVRLVFAGEHLASIPSGVGWQGVSEIYRETIVARAPEQLRFSAELPARPALELAAATTAERALTFRVEVTAAGDEEAQVFETLVEGEGAWQEAWFDLEGLGGRAVEIVLSLDGEPGDIGFWGAPAIRSRSTAEAPAGVILVIADTLRSDHLAAYGYGRETAPTLSRIAGEGVRFADAVTQGTWTKVSVTAIQSSLYPTTHTVADIPDRLPSSATTLAEVYRDAGYATLALTTISFVGRLTALHQGYEVLHESASVDDALGPKSARELVGRLLPWIERHRDTPFFALLHVADPHSPYRPLAADETVFSEAGDMDRLDGWLEEVRPHIEHSDLMKRFGMPLRSELVDAGLDPEAFVRHELDGYDSSIHGMDRALADLFERLEALDLIGRVLVALVSDHGTEFLDHDAHFHGHTVYGELNRVPMLLWQPGAVPAGRVVDETVQTIDLMPTLLELSGLPAPEAVQGESLTTLFSEVGEARWNRPAITEAPMNLRGDLMTAIQVDGWKLIRVGAPEDPSPAYELYRSAEDPLNLNDVAAENGDVVERLAQQMESWRRFAASARLDEAALVESMDAEELQRLRSLGYVQ